MKRVEQCYLPPGLCFICETTPQEGQAVVDTERNFQAVAISPLDGRKYLCGGCITAAGAVIGLASDEALTAATTALALEQAKNAALRDKFRAVADDFSSDSLTAVENAAPALAVAAAEVADAAPKAPAKKKQA